MDLMSKSGPFKEAEKKYIKEQNELFYIQEIYRDEYNTLEQIIIFEINDFRKASYLRSTINPNLKLVDTIYLNINTFIISF